ncbi:MAG: IclR family transcriptional regulator [Paenibacillus sp.]|nr:IclR family transcriptional regulator [Paenibacillus sp.]
MTEHQEGDENDIPYYRIQSVDRTMNILKCFIAERRALGVSELARMLGLNKSAVHRFLLTLKDHGFVEQLKDSDRYMIGPTAFELGTVYTNSTDLTVEGKKVLGDLVQHTGCLAHLAILDQSSVLYLVNVEPDHRQYLFGAVGQRRPIYHTALGKSLTAWLPEERVREKLKSCAFEKLTAHTINSLEQFLQELELVRQRGLAIDREESTIGVQCVSAPVRNKHGEVVAAISVSGFGLDETKLQEFGLAVKSSAAQLSRRLGSTEHL